jgi:hypothetical protein
METLRQNQEGRLQISIETLKDELLNQYIQKNNESSLENYEALQHMIENMTPKI